MHGRHPLPRIWLMTDERLGDALLGIVAGLPRGSGVVFRHYSLAESERRRLFAKVRAIARARRLTLMLAGPPRLAVAWGADGSHGYEGGVCAPGHLLRSVAVHDLTELRRAERVGADFVFVSPVFPTRSHPGARVLGRASFARLARQAHMPVIALGGMNVANARRLGARAYGWAGIDAFA